MMDAPPRNPVPAGLLLAALAAVAFGITTPFIRRLGGDMGPFATASLLYLGAALGAVPLGCRGREGAEARVRWRHLPRIAIVALLGAAVAPSLLAWGLQRVPASYGSLLLNGEAVFTVMLAALLLREPVGGRVALAVLLMLAGGVVTLAGGAGTGPLALVGMLAVLGAVLAWALDNVLTRPLADLDPSAVIRLKALLGASLTGALALLAGEPRPGTGPLVGLLLCGATGYGASLRLYLLAQRRVGAARTGSVFAAAPFVGALVAILLGDGDPSVTMAIAAVLFAVGMALHLSERHAHEHAHRALDHDHAHRHDDGHHDHRHDVSPSGFHAHPHHHGGVAHAHPHAPDVHHAHEHEPEPVRLGSEPGRGTMSHTTDPTHEGHVLHSGRLYDLLGWFVRRTDGPILDLAAVESGDRLLDVGTGPGYLARAAAPRVGASGRAVGLDASPEMIAHARRRAAREASSAEFVEAGAQRMPFGEGEFDVVVSRLAMHHLPGEVRERALAEMARVLRPGGRLLLVDMLAPSPVRMLHDIVRGAPSGSDGGEGGLPAAVRRAGFADVTTGPVGWLSGVKARKPGA